MRMGRGAGRMTIWCWRVGGGEKGRHFRRLKRRQRRRRETPSAGTRYRLYISFYKWARSAVQRIFAVVCFGKLAWHPLLSPDLSSGALRAPQEMVVPLLEVSIDCIFSSFGGRVIAIVND